MHLDRKNMTYSREIFPQHPAYQSQKGDELQSDARSNLQRSQAAGGTSSLMANGSNDAANQNGFDDQQLNRLHRQTRSSMNSSVHLPHGTSLILQNYAEPFKFPGGIQSYVPKSFYS